MLEEYERGEAVNLDDIETMYEKCEYEALSENCTSQDD